MFLKANHIIPVEYGHFFIKIYLCNCRAPRIICFTSMHIVITILRIIPENKRGIPIVLK